MNSKSKFDISKMSVKSKKTNRNKRRGIGLYDENGSENIEPIIYKKSMMEPIRQKLG
jgi:hypothetical protein